MRNPSVRVVAALGDVHDPAVASGWPYHLMEAGRAAGFIEEGLTLETRRLRVKAWRLGWNAMRVAGGKGRGGFQYHNAFLESLWRPHVPRLRGKVVINCFQLYPMSVTENPDIEKWFFIDQSLLQLQQGYGSLPLQPERVRSILQHEKAGYRSARWVVVHSRWARKSVIDEYEIEPEKVVVAVPGASLSMTAYESWYAHARPKRGPAALRLVFVGREWRRKGLARLIDAIDLARRDGTQLSLRVIGVEKREVPPSMQTFPWIEWMGVISKRAQEDRYIAAVAECDIGCLLSYAEAGGISVREFHALGLPVIGTMVGGLPEHAHPEASFLLPGDATPDQIAELLKELGRDDGKLRRASDAAWERRREFLATHTLRVIERLTDERHG